MRTKILMLAIGLLLFSVPHSVAMAQQLVTCNGPDCTFCSVISLVNNVIDFAVLIAVVIAVIMLVIAGFRLVASKGNPGAMNDAKNLLINICIGILLILASWTIVDTLMKVMVSEEVSGQFGPWNEPRADRCGAINPVAAIETLNRGTIQLGEYQNALDFRAYENESEVVGAGGGQLNQGGTPVTGAVSRDGMRSLRTAGVNVAAWPGIDGPGRTDLAHPQVVAAARRMQDLAVQRYGKQIFQVTAAYTEGVGHSSGSYHYRGIAIDFDPINGGTNTQVAALAREVGFTFVLDEGSHIHADMRALTTAQ